MKVRSVPPRSLLQASSCHRPPHDELGPTLSFLINHSALVGSGAWNALQENTQTLPHDCGDVQILDLDSNRESQMGMHLKASI